MATAVKKPRHWLDRYGNDYHHWRRVSHDDTTTFYRPLGVVEGAFDTDGIYHEGRADVNVSLKLDVKSRCSHAQLRRRVLLAWTVLRTHHVLLMAKALGPVKGLMRNYDLDDESDRFFAVTAPRSTRDAVRGAEEALVFIEDYQSSADLAELYTHLQNSARAIDPAQALSRLFVLPPTEVSPSGRTSLRMILVAAHQVTDGLTNVAWMTHFCSLLNTKMEDLKAQLEALKDPKAMVSRLPRAQEDLYPPIPGSRAMKRWFFLLTVILRHVKKPLPAAFQNPLQRNRSLDEAVIPERKYPSILKYEPKPPLNSYTAYVRIGTRGTHRLHNLCRETKTSIGAGSFVLVAISMMEIHEMLYPSTPLQERMPFIGSFPINPRPFFSHRDKADSLMLAFSDGVVLPFLSSSLPFEGRFRLLVRSADRQLRRYQKRQGLEKKAAEMSGSNEDVRDQLEYMSSRGAGRIIAMSYISAVERAEMKLPEHLRRGAHLPQGQLAATANGSMATCGVSSVGRNSPLLQAGIYDLERNMDEDKEEDAFAADYREMQQNVRARDGEFLVGMMGAADHLYASVSYDGNAMDERLVEMWKEKMASLLESEKAEAKL